MNMSTLTIHGFYDVLASGALGLMVPGIEWITLAHDKVDGCSPQVLRS